MISLKKTLVYSLIFALIFPLLLLLFWSFSQGWSWPRILPGKATLAGWSYFLNPVNGGFGALKTSIIIGLYVTVLAIAISLPAGRALGLYNFAGKELINLLVLAPLIVPPLAITMGIHINFIRYGLADTMIGVVLVHLIPTLPYSIRILTHVYEATGDRLEQQARVLGARGWQRLFYITFPLITPGIVSAGILVFIISFSQYFLTFLIGGGQVISFPMVLFPLVKSGDRLLAAVYSLIFILTALIFTFIMERTFRNNNNDRSDHFYL